MKILMMGTLTNSMNGSARSFVRICNYLAAKHDTYVVIPDAEGVAKLMTEDVRLIIKDLTPLRRTIESLLGVPRSIIAMVRLLKEVKPDVVHINDIPWSYGVLVCKWMNIPVVQHSRYYEKNRLIKKIISSVISGADSIIYVSDFNRENWKIKSQKNITLHNPGVFNFNFDSTSELLLKYALVVSRVSEEKGIQESIQVFNELAKQDDSLYLVIAGDALYEYQKDYLQTCKELTTALEIEHRVIWLGHVNQPHSLYRKTQLYIHLPNFEDPFPTTIMEALALGCRILTNGRGGIKEQVADFEGVCLIDTNESLSEVGSKLVAFMNDSISKYDRGYLYNKRFDENKFYERFEEILVSASTQ